MNFYDYQVVHGVTADEWAVHQLRGLASFTRLDMDKGDYAMIVSLSYDGETWGDEMTIYGTACPMPLPLACRAIRVRKYLAWITEYFITVYYS